MNLDYHTASLYLYMYHKVQRTWPDQMSQFLASISPDQVKSKEELVSSLQRWIPAIHSVALNIHIVGSWFAMPLVDMLFKTFNIVHIDLFDMDKTAVNISQVALRKWGFDTRCQVHCCNYWCDPMYRGQEETPHIVINTSCEHMIDTFDDHLYNFEANTVFALQSNNKRHIAEHINCVDSPKELAEQNGIEINTPHTQTATIYLDGGYERYQVIGHKSTVK